MRLPWAVTALVLLGCRPTATNGGPPGTASHKVASATGSFERPVVRCGPQDSYTYVAREFRCPGGDNPLRGQMEGAQRARLGSRRHPSGHIVDLYEVPCAGGPVMVYVDMYGCPEAQALLQPAMSAELTEATAAFDGGEYRQAVGLCMRVLERDQVDAASVECLALTPAAMILDGAEEGGLRLVGAFCGRAASMSTSVRVRQQHVLHVVRWLARGSRGKVSRGQFRQMVDQVATACGVNDGQGA